MELVDLYDINFNKVNKTIRRRVDEIPEGCYVMMSYALIKNNNKYLLEQATSRSNNTLAIPGGHLLSGEDGLTGLKRELKEELNLDNLSIKYIDTIIYPYKSYIFNIYLIEDEIDINKIEYDTNEVVNINWYTKEEIYNYIKEGKVNKGYAFILENYLNWQLLKLLQVDWGFLFKIMEKSNANTAIIVSSITFGIGHIVNLLNGADLLPTILQVCYAIAIGYMLVIILYKSKSIIPCIIFHGVFNSLSIFNNGNNEIYSSILLIILCIGYMIYINKKIKEIG